MLRGQRKCKRKAEQLTVTILRGMLELPAEIGGCRKMCHVCDFLPCLIGIELVPGKESIALGKLSAPSEQMEKWLPCALSKCRLWNSSFVPMFSPSILFLCAFTFALHFSKLTSHHFSVQVHIQGFHWVSGLRGTLDISSCRHICPLSWSPSSPGSPSGSIMMPLQLG